MVGIKRFSSTRNFGEILFKVSNPEVLASCKSGNSETVYIYTAIFVVNNFLLLV